MQTFNVLGKHTAIEKLTVSITVPGGAPDSTLTLEIDPAALRLLDYTGSGGAPYVEMILRGTLVSMTSHDRQP